MAATSARKVEPWAPSASRWSKEAEGLVTQRGSIRSSDPSPTTQGPARNLADTENAGFPWIQNGGARVDGKDADIGDRERAAGHVRRLSLAITRPRHDSWIAAASSTRLSDSALLTLGTRSPRVVAAAIPRFTELSARSPAPVHPRTS